MTSMDKIFTSVECRPVIVDFKVNVKYAQYLCNIFTESKLRCFPLFICHILFGED